MSDTPAPHPSEALAGKLGALIRDAFLHAKADEGPEHHAAKHQAQYDFVERLEQEFKPNAGIVRDAFASMNLSGSPFGALLDNAADPEHAADFFGQLVQGVVFAFVFQVMGMLTPIALQDLIDEAWKVHPGLEVSPNEAASMVVKGIIDQDQGASEVVVQGINAKRFDWLVKATGNPPGPQELQEAARRGIIDEATFIHGIKQGYTKDEWIPTFQKLRFGPPSAAQAIAGYVQSQLSEARARELWHINGLDPADFDWVYDTAGDPPGIQQGAQLYNRGFLTRPQFEQLIKESHVKNKYVDAEVELARHLIPTRTLNAIVKAGVETADWAMAYLHTIGYTEEDAAVLLATSSAQKVEGHKTAALGIVETAYTTRQISEPEAVARMVALGYETSEAAFVLAVREAQREQSMEDHAVGVVRTRYTRRHMTRPEAAATLGAIGLSIGHRDELLLQWDIERDVITKELPVGELNWAVANGAISPQEYADRLLGLGWSPDDVTLLLAHHGPAPADTGVPA